MKITIIGTGYVGSVTGACLAELGNTVTCLDIDPEKIDKFKQGIMPIYEPGLNDLVKRNIREDRLAFTTDSAAAIKNAEVIFIAVGTPSDDNGDVNLKFIESAARDIARYMGSYTVIVDKSTVPVGTADKIKAILGTTNKKFDMVSNPEFLREGEAIKDFMNPDRVVIGVDSDKAKEIMIKIYKGIERTGKPILITDIKSAELIKYASNAMLATRISFMNEVSRLCEVSGADIKLVAKGMGLDNRIGPRFLQAGIGYGGSCFPKDVKGLIKTGEHYGVDFKLLKAVEATNQEQKKHIIPIIVETLGGNVKEKTIAVWGLAFKPKTDDMREASSVVLINELQKLGAKINAFDPESMEVAKTMLSNVKYGKDAYDTIKDVDALVIATEWDEFRGVDLIKIRSLLKTPIIFDGRNIYDPAEMKELGFTYYGVGRPR